MIKIVNNKKGVQILIDDKHPSIIITPKPYEDDYPSFQIDFIGFDYEHHSYTCSDCKELFNDFNTTSTDWFLFWDDKMYRLDLSTTGKGREHNLISRVGGKYFTGTKLKFSIVPETVETLQAELEKSLTLENYERCAVLHKWINELGNQ